MDSSESSTTRRLLIGGSVASLGAAASLATARSAAASPGGLNSSAGDPPAPAVDATESLPTLGAGVQTLYFGPLGWAVYDFAAGATVIIGSSSGSRQSSGYLGRSIDLPPGSTITGMDVTFRGSPVSGSAYIMQATPDTNGSWFSSGSVSTSAAGTVSADLNLPVTTSTSFSIEVVPGNATTFVSGARIRYTPPVPSGLNLVAITPARVYDSRRNMSPDANGKLGTGANRTLSVANGRNPSTGVVTIPNVVPTTAKAIAYTLTVTGSTTGGYLAVNPGGDTTIHGSTINWSAGDTLANSGVIGISGSRTITVIGGSGSTHFIVDVIGYYVQ